MKRSIPIAILLLTVTAFAFAQSEPGYDVSILARLEYKTGPDAIPPNQTYMTNISKVRFYLFDVEPAGVLKAAGLKPEGLVSYGESDEYALFDWFISAGRSSRKSASFESASAVLKPHVIQTALSSDKGEAVFRAVRPGVYYVAGGARPPLAQLWDLRIEVRGPISIRLNQGNRMKITFPE